MIKISKINIQQSDIDRLLKVINSGNLVQGAECAHFQESLSAYLESPHTLLVTSGTAALYLSMITLGIGPEDAVLVPNFTFPATVNVVRLVGATPLLVDVDPKTYTITGDSIENTIQSYQGDKRIKAIIPVHEFGYPADMIQVMRIAQEHDLLVIEDAACALGATIGAKKVGTFGDIGCFSFHPRKVVTTGEGGLLTTHSDELASRLTRLRNHGMDRSAQGIEFIEPGYNFRLTDLQASLGIGQLERLNGWINDRIQLAKVYENLLSDMQQRGWFTLPETHPGHTWQTYMVVLSEGFNRERVIEDLHRAGVETNVGAQCISSIHYMRGHRFNSDLSHSKMLGEFGLALPMCESYTAEILSRVAESLYSVLSEYS